jgi:dTDP-4-amino-4,6-dideoxygalactose transaminase
MPDRSPLGEPVRPPDRFLVFGAPALEPEDIAEVVATLESGWIGTGPRVARFEEAFRRYKHADHSVAVGSGTAALHLSMLAAGLGPGDEVVTSALTFCATVNAIIHAGATPVVVDVDPVTQNLDPAAVEAALTPGTRAVLPVHMAGRPCDMDALLDLAKRNDLLVIEDCAHAVETEWRGRPAGTLGDFGAFSFYVTKNVTTGEGGMVITRREEDAARIKILALHGMSKDAWKRFSDEGYKHYDVVDCGFKSNMMDIQAAMGIHQMERVDANWARRQSIWARYQEAFASLPVSCPAEPEQDTRHAFHLYTLLIDETSAGMTRDDVLQAMTWHGIGTGVHYRALSEHPYYRDRFGWRTEAHPCATDIGRRTISLPLSPALTDGDVEDVIEALRRIMPT